METILKNRSPKLLNQVRDVIWRKHYRIITELTYADWIKRFTLFHRKRHPRNLGKQDITDLLKHLAVDRQVPASTQNQALSALVFVCKEVLNQEFDWLENLEPEKK